MIPLFVATEKFDKSYGGWAKYIEWSGLEDLDEVLSLDISLCPTVLPEVKPEYWSRIAGHRKDKGIGRFELHGE